MNWATIHHHLRPLKPKTLGGRIYAILLLGGTCIFGLGLLITDHFHTRTARYQQAEAVGILIAEFVSRHPNAPTLVTNSLLRISPIAPHEVPQHTGQTIPYPDDRLQVRLYFHDGALSSEQLKNIANNPHWFPKLSKEIARQGRTAKLVLTFPNQQAVQIDAPAAWVDAPSSALAFLLFVFASLCLLYFLSFCTNLLAGSFLSLPCIAIKAHPPRSVALSRHEKWRVPTMPSARKSIRC